MASTFPNCALGLEFEAYDADAGGDVEAGIALDAQGLQRDRLVEAADQDIGPKTDAEGRARGGPGIVARQGTGTHVGTGRHHAPDQDGRVGKADIEAEASDRT